MELQINHIWPQIAIDSTPPQQSIEQKPAQVEITTEPMTASFEGEAFKLEINQYQCFAEAGLKSVFDLIKTYAEEGRAAALEGIGRRAAEGTQMAAIDKGARVEKIVANRIMTGPADITIGFIPQSRPEISFRGGKEYIFKPGKVNINITASHVTHDYKPGSLEVYLKQKAEFQINFVPGKLDQQV